MNTAVPRDVLQPVILSGGSGTRLWPASREHYPKQLLPLTGERSMLQATARRLDGFTAAALRAPLVVGNEEYRFIVAEQLRNVGIEDALQVLEPAGRNTAPALTLAAAVADSDGADPILLVMPADHAIGDEGRFRDAITKALPYARDGAFVTFGVIPARAETGYGYLRRGDAALGGNDGFALDAFVEKPDAATARKYVDSGEYLWNAGIFMMRASVWSRAVGLLQPAMLDACGQALVGAKREGGFLRVTREAFLACPSDSIDYAVMEKLAVHPQLGRAVVIPLDACWSDVGSWEGLWQVSDHDADGNVSQGDVLAQDTRDSLLFSGSRLVVAIGCRDMVVVETPDAVLVADKRATQKVREAVAVLKQRDREEVKAHRKVYRPWGWYDSIEHQPGFQVKRIGVNPGASLSLQMHHRRAEHWVVVRGTARVTRDDEVFDLQVNESVFIPLGARHRLQNITDSPVEIIEVQCGDYLGEDDIVRFEDVYART